MIFADKDYKGGAVPRLYEKGTVCRDLAAQAKHGSCGDYDSVKWPFLSSDLEHLIY